MSCPRGCCASYREHLDGIAIFGPSKQRDAARREDRDMDAYKRLRQSGVQPKQITGAAELEKVAEAKHEVERANIITDRRLRQQVTKVFEGSGPDAA